MKKILLFAVCCLLSSASFAQDNTNKSETQAARHSEIGLWLGASNYMGDLVQGSIDTKEINAAVGGFGRIYLNSKLALRFGGTVTTLSGNDANYPERAARGFSFKSKMVEVAVVGEYHFLGKAKYGETGLFEKNFSPYVFGGLAAALNDATTEGLIEGSSDTAGFGKFKVAIPLGAGLRFDLNEKWRLGLEVGFRPTLSDALDGVETSGNPDNNDWYHLTGINLSYAL